MTSRRVLITVGLLAVFFNCLRVVFRFGIGFGSDSGGAQLFGLALVFVLALVIAKAAWIGERAFDLLPSALWGAACGAAVGLLAVYVSTLGERTYGMALFVLTPISVGFSSAFAMGARGKTSAGDAIVSAMTSTVLLGCALVAFALEGGICLLMAIPIAVPFALMGALIAYGLRNNRFAHPPTFLLLFLGFTPFTASLEHALPRQAEIVQVATSIDIPASPEQVWQAVLRPARLSAPSQILFRAGVAYPLASHIEGTGPSAIRYCDFSTGKLVEPVLIWDDERRLRFTVRSNPLPMQEWTPYARLHPPHLDGFLVSRQGEFFLEALPNGETRLTATTWYQDHLYPAPYWKLWSDYIIHQVHRMVLENVRERALVALQKDGSLEKAHSLAADGHTLAAILAP
jgi:Polyketide cyclase / dehydrase and lipid transport